MSHPYTQAVTHRGKIVRSISTVQARDMERKVLKLQQSGLDFENATQIVGYEYDIDAADMKKILERISSKSCGQRGMYYKLYTYVKPAKRLESHVSDRKMMHVKVEGRIRRCPECNTRNHAEHVYHAVQRPTEVLLYPDDYAYCNHCGIFYTNPRTGGIVANITDFVKAEYNTTYGAWMFVSKGPKRP